jgi:exopolysaccharide biosynthesis polyprenyl glycosylphosphotransferase
VLAWTLCARWLARRVAERLTDPERILIVGDEGVAARIAHRLDYQGSGARVVGRIRPGDTRLGDGSPLGFTALSRVVGELGADRMIIVPTGEQRAIDLIRAAKALGVRVSVSPRTLEVIGGNAASENLYGTGLLSVPALELPRSASALKRVFDLAGAALVLTLLAPLMLTIAVAIVLDSPGPVLFRQERVGRDGTRFWILKFRTMVDGAEAMKAALAERNETQGLFKIARDPRVTRVGRLLRTSSLDELPQLLNVLRGEMSLVGPRPLEVGEDEQIVGWDRRRLVLTPGMTGPWQILGGGRVPLDEMVKIDYRYVAGWSLWEDVKIMLRTVPHVLARRAV